MAKTNLEKKYALTILLVTVTGLMFLLGLQAFQLNHAAARLKQQSQLSFADETENQLQQRGVAHAEALASNIAEPYLSLDMLAIYEIMLPVKKATGVRNVYFFRTDGRILHDGTNEILSYDNDVALLYPDVQPDLRADQFIWFESSMAIMRPVMTESEHLGGVLVEISTKPYSDVLDAAQRRLDSIANSSMRESMIQLLLAGFGMVLVAALWALIAGRRLARPIKKLAEQAERIGAGDYHAAVQLSRDDEVGDLATAFENMRSNLREQTERIEHQAYFDTLTGLRNRTSFHELMSRTLVDSPQPAKHVLLYLDIDGFKRINDGLGHGAGDRLLKLVAKRLSDWSRQISASDSDGYGCELARWGSDQFTVLLKNVNDLHAIEKQARILLQELSRPSNIAGVEVVMSSSIGYAVFPDDARDSDTLISYADLAMYQSKERGHNYVSAYQPQNTGNTADSLVLESEIRTALREQQFELMYYPIIDTTSKGVTGLEVKVIWNHPDRGALEPRHFFTLLSTAGLLNPFRIWGYNLGLDNLKKWQSEGYDNLSMTFNLANLDFDPGWLGEIVALGLERTEIDSRDVSFEISESSFSKNVVRTAEVLQDLGKFGINVWINNFGIGYSSLNRLRRVSFAGLKIHHSVVADLNTSRDSQHMVSASIAMAHGFGIQAAADGVADEQQLRFLRQKGCDFVQGTIASPPLSAEEVEAYLARSYAGPRLFKASIKSKTGL